MKAIDFVILGVIAVAVFFALRRVRRKKAGGCSCCCESCGQACPMKRKS